MNNKQARKIFLNISVSDLKHSMEFLTTLGFAFNPKCTDDKACMIVSEIYKQ